MPKKESFVKPTNMSQSFSKAYTRNFSIIMQEAWFAAHQDLVERLDCGSCPYSPTHVYFMVDGVEEVWENEHAQQWFLDRLQEKIVADPNFFFSVHDQYNKLLAEIKEWWKRDISTAEDLRVFVEKVFQSTSLFVVLYDVLMIESLPEDIRKVAEAFREQDVFFAECNATIWRALQKLYPDFGYFVVYIIRDEIGTEFSREELHERDKDFAYIPGIVRESISFLELQQKFPDFLFRIEEASLETELKGQVAFRGVVSGKVRIVKRKDQIASVQEGDIIVSPMTTPDFMPAMKKAAAFVTDEGGITCHAAIIAREMQKPCVIGTKSATKILKDGDFVEVDAEKGIVRKI